MKRVSMRAHHPSLGLYLKNLGECTRGGARHNGQEAVGESGAQEPLALGRPTYGVGRPQSGPPVASLWPGDSSTVINFENMVHGQKFARKDVQIIFFQRILKLKKYFWSFCKKGKVLEKFQRAENNFKNFKHAVEKNK